MDKEMKKQAKKEDSSDMATEAKVKALKELRDLSSNMMQDDLKGRMSKKVTVAAPDNEGLKAGLDVAEKAIEKSDDNNPMGEAEEMLSEDSEEDDISDIVEDCESPEEIDALIKKLQEKKASMK